MIRTFLRDSPIRVAALLAGILLVVASSSLRADSERAAHPRITLLVFHPTLNAPVPKEGPDADSIARLIHESLVVAARDAGYDPVTYNRDSPSVIRAIDRERTLTLEDISHPEETEAARRLAAVHGARCAVFPQIVECAIDVSRGRARLTLALRVVPHAGAEREILGSGTAEFKLDKRVRNAAGILLQQAADTAAQDVVRQLPPALGNEGVGQAAPAQAQSYYEQAMQSLKENRLVLAISLLERATLLAPHNVEYATALGDAYQQNKKIANAIMEYRRAVTLQPNVVDLRMRLAKAYLQRGMLREATVELRRAATLAPSDEGVRAVLVEAYERNGMTGEAVAEYRRLVKARPDDAGLRLSLGDLLLSQGLLEEARGEYSRAASLDPQSPAPHEKLSQVYRRRKMHPEAIREILLAQRMSAAGDDAERYRVMAGILDEEADRVNQEIVKTTTARKAGNLVREDAYLAIKPLAARAGALGTAAAELKVPPELAQSHRRRVFAYSLLNQCILAYLSYYEADTPADGTNADLLLDQSARELQQARTAAGTP